MNERTAKRITKALEQIAEALEPNKVTLGISTWHPEEITFLTNDDYLYKNHRLLHNKLANSWLCKRWQFNEETEVCGWQSDWKLAPKELINEFLETRNEMMDEFKN